MSEGVVIIWLACAIGGWAIGNSKGRGGSGFVLGLLLGVIGLIIAIVMKPDPSHSSNQMGHKATAHSAGYPVSVATTQTATTPAGWHLDPHRRFDHRYWDGRMWTVNVSNQGVAMIDPSGAMPTPPLPVPTSPIVPPSSTLNSGPAVLAGQHCSQCGTPTRPDARFCAKCGAAIQAADA